MLFCLPTAGLFQKAYIACVKFCIKIQFVSFESQVNKGNSEKANWKPQQNSVNSYTEFVIKYVYARVLFPRRVFGLCMLNWKCPAFSQWRWPFKTKNMIKFYLDYQEYNLGPCIILKLLLLPWVFKYIVILDWLKPSNLLWPKYWERVVTGSELEAYGRV